MTPASRRRGAAATLVAGLLLVAACMRATPSPSPSPSASPARRPHRRRAAPSASPSATERADRGPTPTASPAATPAADCVVEPQEGPLSSDRMTDVVISSTDDADVITFVFGRTSLPGPAGQPTGDLDGRRAALSPRRAAASPSTWRATTSSSSGSCRCRCPRTPATRPTTGRASSRPDLPVLRHAVEFDATEGQIGWYIGYDGPGCVTLGRDGNDVTSPSRAPDRSRRRADGRAGLTGSARGSLVSRLALSA